MRTGARLAHGERVGQASPSELRQHDASVRGFDATRRQQHESSGPCVRRHLLLHLRGPGEGRDASLARRPGERRDRPGSASSQMRRRRGRREVRGPGLVRFGLRLGRLGRRLLHAGHARDAQAGAPERPALLARPDEHASGAVSAWSATRSILKAWSETPAAISPADGATLTYPMNPLMLKWSSVPRTFKYSVTVASDPNLATPLAGFPILTTATTLSYQPPDLKPDMYYWSVTPQDARGNKGAPSDVSSFVWNWPTLMSPEVADLVDADELYDPRFSWSLVPGAASYEVRGELGRRVRHGLGRPRPDDARILACDAPAPPEQHVLLARPGDRPRRQQGRLERGGAVPEELRRPDRPRPVEHPEPPHVLSGCRRDHGRLPDDHASRHVGSGPRRLELPGRGRRVDRRHLQLQQPADVDHRDDGLVAARLEPLGRPLFHSGLNGAGERLDLRALAHAPVLRARPAARPERHDDVGREPDRRRHVHGAESDGVLVRLDWLCVRATPARRHASRNTSGRPTTSRRSPAPRRGRCPCSAGTLSRVPRATSSSSHVTRRSRRSWTMPSRRSRSTLRAAGDSRSRTYSDETTKFYWVVLPSANLNGNPAVSNPLNGAASNFLKQTSPPELLSPAEGRTSRRGRRSAGRP